MECSYTGAGTGVAITERLPRSGYLPLLTFVTCSSPERCEARRLLRTSDSVLVDQAQARWQRVAQESALAGFVQLY
jgi:hypothetical protein